MDPPSLDPPSLDPPSLDPPSLDPPSSSQSDSSPIPRPTRAVTSVQSRPSRPMTIPRSVPLLSVAHAHFLTRANASAYTRLSRSASTPSPSPCAAYMHGRVNTASATAATPVASTGCSRYAFAAASAIEFGLMPRCEGTHRNTHVPSMARRLHISSSMPPLSPSRPVVTRPRRHAPSIAFSAGWQSASTRHLR